MADTKIVVGLKELENLHLDCVISILKGILEYILPSYFSILSFAKRTNETVHLLIIN